MEQELIELVALQEKRAAKKALRKNKWTGDFAKNSLKDSCLEDKVAERNVEIMVQEVKQRSPLLQTMQIAGDIDIVNGARAD
jgi:hypothetical protein